MKIDTEITKAGTPVPFSVRKYRGRTGTRRAGVAAVICALLCCAGTLRAQGSRKDDVVFNAEGRPMAGATVRICTANATGEPCAPLANIYSNAALTQALANPITTDGLGNYSFYAAPGRYMIEISGPGITTKQIPDVILPNDPSAPTFTSLTTTSGISAFSLTLTGDLTVSGSAAVTGALTVGGAPVPSTTQANAWTANQTFQGPRPWIDVEAYGAKGDGTTDDSAAILAAVKASCTSGGTVRLLSSHGYAINTTLDLSPPVIGCQSFSLIGGGGTGWQQFQREPRTRILCNADPCVKFDSVGYSGSVRWENLEFEGHNLGVYIKDAPFQWFINDGFSFTYNAAFNPTSTPSTPYSTALLDQGNVLWQDFEHCNFETGPSSVGHPTTIVRYGSNSGNELVRYIADTFAYGGIEWVADASGTSNGTTFGEMIIDTAVLEAGGGSSSTPLISFINNGMTGTWSPGRIEIHNSQVADTSTNSPLVDVEGLPGDTTNAGGITIWHSLPHGTCAITVSSNASVSGVEITDPVGQRWNVCDETFTPLTNTGEIMHNVSGIDVSGPASLSSALTGSLSLPFRTKIAGDTYATWGRDASGREYWGPGGSSSSDDYDLRSSRSASHTLQWSYTVPAPSGFACSAASGGSFAAGTYYLKIASGDGVNTGNVSSAGATEPSVTLDGSSTTAISCTWSAQTGAQNKYTIYVGTAAGGENKAKNVTGTSNTITAMPAPNISPGSIDSLWWAQFQVTSNGIQFYGSSENLGIFSQANTASRTYTFPDASIDVAGTNAAQTWSGNQTNMALVTPSIGGETLSAAPRAIFSAFLPGALTATWTGATWTPDKAVTITRIQVQAKTAPATCSTNAVVRLSDGTTNQDVAISAAANDSGAISQNYAAGTPLTVAVQTAASGCGTSPTDANVVVQYRMQ